jgi:ABC-type methionine transport system ATPase subunit
MLRIYYSSEEASAQNFTQININLEVLNVLRMLNKQYGMMIVLVEHKVDEVIP